MYFHDERVIRAIDAERRRSVDQAIFLAELPGSGPNPVRRAIGRSLVAVGSRIAADPSPPSRQPARAR
jgi:hypothetical protein